MNFIPKIILAFPTFIFCLICCKSEEKAEPDVIVKSLVVTVSAYNSVPWQTTATNSNITAWGDTLTPGMKAVAVSRDLPAMGLDHGKEVKIEGMPGTYIVLDKMNARYTKRLDIYMGDDVKKAREWGQKRKLITWEVPADSVPGSQHK